MLIEKVNLTNSSLKRANLNIAQNIGMKLNLSKATNDTFLHKNVTFNGDIAKITTGIGGTMGGTIATGVIEGAKAAVLGGASVSAGAVAVPAIAAFGGLLAVGWLIGKGIEKLTGNDD